jgi:hypothetical protein
MQEIWKCRRCECHLELQEQHRSRTTFQVDNPKPHLLKIAWTVCPNLNCQEVTLVAKLCVGNNKPGAEFAHEKQINHWVLLPERKAASFPDYIPKHLVKDYQEACAIKTVSPKASAMLARGCLHGIVRDVWKTKSSGLCDAINEIKDKITPEVWEALEALRKLGNIGAHSAAHSSEMAPVKRNEVELMLSLLELLFTDWYVAREEKHKSLEDLSKAAKQKVLTPSGLPSPRKSRA